MNGAVAYEEADDILLALQDLENEGLIGTLYCLSCAEIFAFVLKEMDYATAESLHAASHQVGGKRS